MKKEHGTVGFGCPDTVDPHHMVVTVPRGRNDSVRIVEQFGLRAGHAGTPDMIERVELPRPKWTAIADSVRRVFNERLKEKGISPGRWSVGDNKIERLLGKELCVLAWAIEDAAEDLIPVAITNWSGLKPEERWWLFTMTAAATGEVDDSDIGWRKALRFALTENPVETVAPAQRRSKKARQQTLSLFREPEESPG